MAIFVCEWNESRLPAHLEEQPPFLVRQSLGCGTTAELIPMQIPVLVPKAGCLGHQFGNPQCWNGLQEAWYGFRCFGNAHGKANLLLMYVKLVINQERSNTKKRQISI